MIIIPIIILTMILIPMIINTNDNICDNNNNNNNNNNTAGCVEVCCTDPLRGLLHPDRRGGQVPEHEV